MKKKKKQRIDEYLVDKAYYPDIDQARRAIMAGLVFSGQERVNSASESFGPDAEINIKSRGERYVSRGGFKLEKALDSFCIDLKDKIMIDIGSSTGGFSDCGLQNGVSHVYAVDVGYGQLDWKLRSDDRVTVLERTNFRHLDPSVFEDQGRPDFASIDVSFISLKLILPKLKEILLAGGGLVALIKPQFEADKEDVAKGGLVQDKDVHIKVIKDMIIMASKLGYELKGITYSPITGAEGNIEFLAYWVLDELDRPGLEKDLDWDLLNYGISELVAEAHDGLSKRKE